MKKTWILMLMILLATAQAGYAAVAKADIKGTAKGSTVVGTAVLTDTEKGLRVAVQLTGVPSGMHGIHIHENGNCTDFGNGAGGHYNPDGVKHGMVMKDGLTAAHVGDMGNIEINAEGRGTLSMVIPGVTVSGGKYNVAGRSIILHEKQDDFGQPTGNAGARIGCGMIQEAQA